MAKYSITFSCGHAGTVQMVGPGKDRDRKLRYFEQQGSCDACRAAELEARRAADAAEAAKQAAEAGLPALQGSDKQVAWAERIRAEILPSIKSEINFAAERGRRIATDAHKAGIADVDDLKTRLAAVGDVRTVALADAAAQGSAKWWIDNRNPASFEQVAKPVHVVVEREFGGLVAQLDALKAESEAKAKAERDALNTAEAAARRDERATSIVKAQTFRVSDRDGSVVREGSNLVIESRDGRVARGFVDDGDWAVYQIGDHDLDSSHPEMERIAAEAKAVWEARA